jgi:hypothetical protein
MRRGAAFDAFDKRHLPLDELTAPYTVTNFTTTMEFLSSTSVDQVIVVSPRITIDETRDGALTDYIACRYDGEALVNSETPVLQSVRCPIINVPTAGSAAIHSAVRARLHNLSVRVECLGTNTGLYPPGSAYVGTVPNIEGGQYAGGGGIKVKQAWADDAIQVGYLKSVPAASLVEKPVQIDAAVAETVNYKTWRDITVPPNTVEIGKLTFSQALEPIVVYVPRCGAGDTAVNYRLVIGQQWCSRHPQDIMLRATQKQHPATKPDVWHKAVGAVQDIGQVLMHHAANSAMRALTNQIGPVAIADRGPPEVMW